MTWSISVALISFETRVYPILLPLLPLTPCPPLTPRPSGYMWHVVLKYLP